MDIKDHIRSVPDFPKPGILFYDISTLLAHAKAWQATVERMAKLGAHPGRLHAYVSPCISVEQFEVGPEVAVQFDDAVVHHPPAKEKPHVDLKAAIVAQLEEAGLPAASVEVSLT